MDIDDISLFDAANADVETVQIETPQSGIETEISDDHLIAASTTDPAISVRTAVDVSVDVSPNIDMDNVSESEALDIIAVAEPTSDASLPAELDSSASETPITDVENMIDDVLPSKVSDSSNSNKVQSNDSIILLPKVDDYVRYVDPDTQQEETVHIFQPAGKASCGNRNWRNVRNMVTGTKKCVDFSRVKWWPLEQKTIYRANDSADVQEAQLDEL